MKNLIVILLTVVLAGAGGWFYYSNKTKTQPEVATQSESVNEAETSRPDETGSESGVIKDNLFDLLGSGKSQMCTYSYTDEEGQVLSGEVYIVQNDMRTDYKMTGGEVDVNGSMLKTGDDMYIWASNMPQGIKMKYDPEKFTKSIEEDLNGSDSDTPATVDPNREVEYDCRNWSSDPDMFTPPSDVSFTDVSAVIEKFQDNSTLENICETCNTLSGENKEACLKQLNCGN